ncbi:hypothetical protein [Tahibacter caeni]|uniref:hypothetical protein n=1 Tax=Tahibacter caeni TaxID=1453545 RepID=UPI002148F5FA|nr:hypothetical protein [Tahibacter caeni]
MFFPQGGSLFAAVPPPAGDEGDGDIRHPPRPDPTPSFATRRFGGKRPTPRCRQLSGQIPGHEKRHKRQILTKNIVSKPVSVKKNEAI